MNTKYLLIVIIFLGAFLRFYKVDTYPAFNADEAALGYNAYSLLKTGKDEHGNPWPTEFQSFNDYKPGGYVYLTLPFILTLGMTELAVRLPNILMSVFSIYLIYQLSTHLFPGFKLNLSHRFTSMFQSGRGFTGALGIGHITSFLLAISPWHIHFSRGGWEVNTATTLFLLGLVLFLKSSTHPKLLIFSTIAFVLSMYTYHSMRLIAPIFILVLFLLSRRAYKILTKTYFESGVILILLIFPLVVSLLGDTSSSRFKGVGIFADPGPASRAEELRKGHAVINAIPNRLLHNRVIEYSLRIFDNYSRHFSASFLFLEGDEIQRNKVPDMGQLYLFEIITLGLGIFILLKIPGMSKQIIFTWLLLSPMAASLTFQSPHALRAQNMVIPLTLISSLGLFYLLQTINLTLNSPGVRQLLTFALFLLIFWNLTFYLHNYYSHMSKSYPYSSQYSFKQMIDYVTQIQSQYDKVIITTRYDQPYIMTLFYTRYNPADFQNSHTLTSPDKFGFSTVPSFDKFYFKSISSEDFSSVNTIIVGSPSEISSDLDPLQTIYFPSGEPAYKIIQT